MEGRRGAVGELAGGAPGGARLGSRGQRGTGVARGRGGASGQLSLPPFPRTSVPWIAAKLGPAATRSSQRA